MGGLSPRGPPVPAEWCWIAELNSDLGPSTVYNDLDVSDDHVARAGDLLFAWSGSLTVRRWFRAGGYRQPAHLQGPSGTWNPHVAASRVAHSDLDAPFPGYRCATRRQPRCVAHNAQRYHLDDLWLSPERSRSRTRHGVQPLWERALCAERESLYLTSSATLSFPSCFRGRFVYGADR